MFESGYEFIMWQTYRDRVREGETNRLVRKARARQKRSSRLLARLPAWLGRQQAALQAERPARLQSGVRKAATDPRTGGGLIL